MCQPGKMNWIKTACVCIQNTSAPPYSCDSRLWFSPDREVPGGRGGDPGRGPAGGLPGRRTPVARQGRPGSTGQTAVCAVPVWRDGGGLYKPILGDSMQHQITSEDQLSVGEVFCRLSFISFGLSALSDMDICCHQCHLCLYLFRLDFIHLINLLDFSQV